MAKQSKAYFALIFICIVWGTTYLALRVGVIHYPAFLFAGVRQTISGIILCTLALLFNKNKDLSRTNILRQMLVGFLLLTVGNGCVTWGEKYVPSGIAALICSMMPIFAVLFNVTSSSKEQFNKYIGFGMVLGAVGVGLIFKQDLGKISDPKYLMGILSVLLATASWAYGSMINKRNVDPVNPFLNSGLQLFFGGVFMLVLSPVIDDYKGLVLWNRDGMLALVYLIVFGSVLAYAAYMFVLSKLPVGIATIYAYINPLVAVILGALILGETLNIYTALAFITVIVSVVLVNKGYRMQHRAKLEKDLDDKIANAFPETQTES